ncbi:MAG: hypothetical protein ACD_65C00182G0001 [uncultured bacterium]|nr:MAG: hypothetical protein ACD_65C00182G0001 [uncultured bacterium]KKT02214.1 MAG: hypothetical protein UV80_C0005G0059 [Candidatus Peregrinibacteria bacterium GW2011_GWF2_43_17]KKT19686.1 MAG: hypothetical protein UW03_C0015G0062 [Candidatus Peregrinibacteria bacterium GW2011_GWA2_43_8]HAU40025.1 hypothetical protein [Candidatus Peregrinibacteria bacterium]
MMKILVISTVITLLLLFGLTLLNVLLQYKNKANAAWTELENAFIKRRDMVPLLLESARIEDPRWTVLKDKRGELLNNQIEKNKRLELEKQFGNAISAFIAIADGNKDSVFQEAKKDLMKDIHDEINPAMQKYLDYSEEFNDKLRKFPYIIAAKIFRP